MKRWLRGPDSEGEPQVELIGNDGWYWRSGHYGQREERSVIVDLLGDEAARFRVSDGVYLFPGRLP